jgi:pimeloyl-ACP methyl ester carboxylesterase
VVGVVTETDLELTGRRSLHIYDTCADDSEARLTVFWHHGTPNTGAPPEPLLPAAAERGIRWVSYDRPGYGGSTPLAGPWPQRPPMSPGSPTRLASASSP